MGPAGGPKARPACREKMPEAWPGESVSVVAAAVIGTGAWVRSMGAGLKEMFEVAAAVAAVERVTTLPLTLLMVVPGAMPAPLTYMPADRPVLDSTVKLVLPLVETAGTDVTAVLAGALKITVPVPVVP